MSHLLRLAGFVGIAAAVLAAPRAAAVGCDDESDAMYPDEVEGGGVVTAVSGRTFKVGEVTFVRPSSFKQLLWCDGPPDPEDEDSDESGNGWRIPRFHVGDVVQVGGSLRADGSVLAYWGYANEDPDGYDVENQWGPTTISSGIATSVDGDFSYGTALSFSMNGTAYRVFDGGQSVYSSHDSLYATDPIDGSDIDLPQLAPGDTVFTQFHVDADGERVATDVFVRMSGADSVVAGTITNVWSDGGEFAVDGVPAVCDDVTQLVFKDPVDGVDPEDPDNNGFNFQGLRTGQIVEVTGILRGGVVFADKLVIVKEPESPGAKRLARRLGRLRAHGVLEGRRADGAVVVSGLAVTTRGRVARSLPKSAPAAGVKRVNVAATIKGGVILASAIRGR